MIRWTEIEPGTEVAEVWARDPQGKRTGLRPIGCWVRTVHHNAETVISAPVWFFGTTLRELQLAGHP